MDASEPAADDQDVRDLSSIEGVDEMLARYRRAGEVALMAKRFRRNTRAKIIAALAGADEGHTKQWAVLVRRKRQATYTVEEHDLTYLFIEPLEHDEHD